MIERARVLGLSRRSDSFCRYAYRYYARSVVKNLQHANIYGQYEGRKINLTLCFLKSQKLSKVHLFKKSALQFENLHAVTSGRIRQT